MVGPQGQLVARFLRVRRLFDDVDEARDELRPVQALGRFVMGLIVRILDYCVRQLLIPLDLVGQKGWTALEEFI